MTRCKLAFIVLLLPVLALASDRLNVKPGLWEITATSETKGAPALPADVLASMTPERRAQMESMAKSTGRKRTYTSTDCITEADLEKPFKPDEDEACTSTVINATPTSQEIKLVCGGDSGKRGTFHLLTPDPQTMTGVIDIKTADGGMTIHTNLKGKWVSASCQGAE